MVGETLPSSVSSQDDVAAATPDSVEVTTTTNASAGIAASNHLATGRSSNSAVPADDANLFALLLLQSLDVPPVAAAHSGVDDVDAAANKKEAVSNIDDHGIRSAIVRPPAIMGFHNHTMMNEHAAWDDDDSSIPPPHPATEIHCRPDNDDLVSAVSSITRATSVGTSAASHGVRLARSYHTLHMGNLMSGDRCEMIPSTIGGTPPPLPIGAIYEQSQQRSRTTKDSTGGSGGGISNSHQKQQRPSHDKQAHASALSSCEAAKMTATPSSPRRPCQAKNVANDMLGPNRPCDGKELVKAGGGLAAATASEPSDEATSAPVALDATDDEMESGDFFTNTLAVARLVALPQRPSSSSSATVPTSSVSHSLEHSWHLRPQRLAPAEAAREEFRRQVRSELLQEAVRAEPVSSSLSTPPRETTTTVIPPMSSSAKRIRTKVAVCGVLALLVVVAVAVIVRASLGRKSEPSTTTTTSGDIESSSATATAPPLPFVYLDDGRQAFTSTQQLYDAVDDYLQTNRDDNDNEITAVNSSATAAALTYGYPIGTWDVSRISDFSKVFCPDRDVTMDPNVRFESHSKFNEDLSGWNVSNAVSLHGMFAECTDFVGEGLERWDTSRVADFSFLLWSNTAFVGNVSTWNTSSATNMKGMFAGAELYNGDLSRWDLAKVHTTARMFSAAAAFEGHGVAQWNVGQVRDMNCMFCEAIKFNSSVSAWNVSNVENMAYLFFLCETFNADLSSWQVGRVSTLEGMFSQASLFQGIGLSLWNTSRVTSLESTFALSSFNQPLHWDVGLVVDFSSTFDRAKEFKGDLSRWNTTSAKRMRHMFKEATSFSSDLSSWNVAQVEDLELMFAGASSFNYSLCSWGPQLSSTANVQDMFSGSGACETQSQPSAVNLSLGPFCRFCD